MKYDSFKKFFDNGFFERVDGIEMVPTIPASAPKVHTIFSLHLMILTGISVVHSDQRAQMANGTPRSSHGRVEG